MAKRVRNRRRNDASARVGLSRSNRARTARAGSTGSFAWQLQSLGGCRGPGRKFWWPCDAALRARLRGRRSMPARLPESAQTKFESELFARSDATLRCDLVVRAGAARDL